MRSAPEIEHSVPKPGLFPGDVGLVCGQERQLLRDGVEQDHCLHCELQGASGDAWVGVPAQSDSAADLEEE